MECRVQDTLASTQCDEITTNTTTFAKANARQDLAPGVSNHVIEQGNTTTFWARKKALWWTVACEIRDGIKSALPHPRRPMSCKTSSWIAVHGAPTVYECFLWCSTARVVTLSEPYVQQDRSA
eukprot:TRINITY_DN13532_c0_g1_i1.p1 TRINITY_DN13532_c0_g1~~TRINITY_DN13532_c0_g1_i1.p1  ORF type:complete len:123 (-),score=9.40 TRINITY_DN13532_c0_g1_i1:190-558(-)